MSTAKSLFKVNNLYAYYQTKRDKTSIEFGWVPVLEINAERPVIIARDPENPDWDNAVLLGDYSTYFLRLTSLTPDEFIKKWAPSPKELKIFWTAKYPNHEDQHEFILKLAFLIRDKTKFEMYGKTYEYFDSKVGEGNEEVGTEQDREV